MALKDGIGPTGMSRRELIRNAGIAGAAAWTAPIIIDSVTSSALATSGSNPHNYACSKGYFFYQITGDATVYWTGFQTGHPQCGFCGANPPGGNNFQGCAATNACLFKGAVSGNCDASNSTNLRYTLGTTTCSDPTTMTPATFDTNCSAHVGLDSVTGKVLTAKAGVTLLGGFAFTGGSWSGLCPSSGLPQNSITMQAGCNDA